MVILQLVHHIVAAEAEAVLQLVPEITDLGGRGVKGGKGVEREEGSLTAPSASARTSLTSLLLTVPAEARESRRPTESREERRRAMGLEQMHWGWRLEEDGTGCGLPVGMVI
jgi:hypothetical protein